MVGTGQEATQALASYENLKKERSGRSQCVAAVCHPD